MDSSLTNKINPIDLANVSKAKSIRGKLKDLQLFTNKVIPKVILRRWLIKNLKKGLPCDRKLSQSQGKISDGLLCVKEVPNISIPCVRDIPVDYASQITDKADNLQNKGLGDLDSVDLTEIKL